MKNRLFFGKVFLSATMLFTASLAQAQTPEVVTIPNANFKTALLNNTAINTNGDGEIQVSEATAYTGEIDVASKNISSLQGIEAFTNITKLRCLNNHLTTLDLSQNTQLKEVNCNINQLTSLNLGNNTVLETLRCGKNQLTTLNVSANTGLKTLICYENELSALNLSANTALKELNCNTNSITMLDLSLNTALETLRCGKNQLTALDVSANTALKKVICYENQLTQLDLSDNTNLLDLNCSRNNLQVLNVNNTNNASLQSFKANGNPLLTCIKIDAGFTPPTTWLKDSTATYSSDCATLSEEGVATISVKVYPNPVQDLLSIVVLESNEAKLYNMQGQYLETVRLNTGENTLDMTKYATGVYFLTIGNSSTKIVKQ